MFICVYNIYSLNVISCLIMPLSVSMSFRCPALFTICSLRYCFVIIGIFWMCLVLHVMSLPVFSPSLCMIASYGLQSCPLQSPICPQSTIISLYSYHIPYRKRKLISMSVIVLKTPVTIWGPHSFCHLCCS